jgi:hypothetical protein
MGSGNRLTMPRAQGSSSVRARNMRALHVGKKKLGWDDDTYRDVLDQITRKRSATECSDAELGMVLDFMRERGFGRAPGQAAPSRDERAGKGAATQLSLIKQLWSALASGGHLSDGSDDGLRAFGKRITGIDAPEFMNVAQRVKVIEGLKGWMKRVASTPTGVKG